MKNMDLNEQNKEVTGLTHECGVFGCMARGPWPTQIDVSQIVCLGLIALQHRGQESAGIVTSEGRHSVQFNVLKGMGMVSNIFNDTSMIKLKGNLGIGHTRYSTSGASEAINCQPFVVHNVHGSLAVAHNGQLVNSEALRKLLCGFMNFAEHEADGWVISSESCGFLSIGSETADVFSRGIGLSTHSDSELITQALCMNPPDGEEGTDMLARIRYLLKIAPLSYSLVIMTKDRIYGVRDPYGNRPLCLGKIVPVDKSEHEADGWVISSESCGFLSIGARYVREVLPGEIVEITDRGCKTKDIIQPPEGKQVAFCIFEYVYFARSDSVFEGQVVYSARMQCGRMLAREAYVEADIVSSVPESGTAAAHGFSKETGIEFVEVLCKNRYVGRTFIQPSTRLRQLGVAKKFGAISVNVEDKRIVLIDDSIVRGNTIGPIIKLLRDAGAKEVHVRIASPPLRHPCYMGINIPTTEELIANRLGSAELADHTGADSLAYLSVEGLKKAIRWKIKKGKNQIGHCTACLTGEYPELPSW